MEIAIKVKTKIFFYKYFSRKKLFLQFIRYKCVFLPQNCKLEFL